MYITVDDNNYINGYATIGNLLNSIEVNDVLDETFFADNFFAYKYENGSLVFDEDMAHHVAHEKMLNELRLRREEECFKYINRGTLWYQSLSVEQNNELAAWYQAWLDVTETLEIPERPQWLE